MEAGTGNLPPRQCPFQCAPAGSFVYRGIRGFALYKNRIRFCQSGPSAFEICEDGISYLDRHEKAQVSVRFILVKVNKAVFPVNIPKSQLCDIACPDSHIFSEQQDRAVPQLERRPGISDIDADFFLFFLRQGNDRAFA